MLKEEIQPIILAENSDKSDSESSSDDDRPEPPPRNIKPNRGTRFKNKSHEEMIQGMADMSAKGLIVRRKKKAEYEKYTQLFKTVENAENVHANMSDMRNKIKYLESQLKQRENNLYVDVDEKKIKLREVGEGSHAKPKDRKTIREEAMRMLNFRRYQ